MFDNNIITVRVNNYTEFLEFAEQVINPLLNRRYLELRRQVQNQNTQTVDLMEIE